MPRARHLIWTTTPPSRGQLRHDGYHVLRFPRLRSAILGARAVGSVRSSLANPAARVLAVFSRHARIAVLDVSCRRIADLALFARLHHGARVSAGLHVAHSRRLHPRGASHGGVRRLRLASCLDARETAVVGRDLPGRRGNGLPSRCQSSETLVPLGVPGQVDTVGRLDPEQYAAVRAGDGVVQVIAPAGSGKTTVLVERVRELRRPRHAGRPHPLLDVQPRRLPEIAARLEREGVAGIGVRSFHGLGLCILKQEGRLRDRIGGRPSRVAIAGAPRRPPSPAAAGSTPPRRRTPSAASSCR